MINLYNYDRTGLSHLLQEWGFTATHAGTLLSALYRDNPQALHQLPQTLQKQLQTETYSVLPTNQISWQSQDGYTCKYLLRLEDGQTVETVQMRYRDRISVCISTQAGCAMGCVFCATGQMGFYRHLLPAEIVGQVLYVNQQLNGSGQKVRNVVLMGMGEPLHNYKATMTAIRILTDDKGLAIAPSHITLSTVGIPDGIRRLADENCPVHLAVSLHAATDEERIALVPPAKRWRLAELMEACRYYTQKRGKRIFFEWTLIAGKNDSPDHAHKVGQLLQGMNAHLNVIPLNPTQGYAGQPSHYPAVRQFQAVLGEYNIPSTLRQRRGIDIAAGCGQLRERAERDQFLGVPVLGENR